MAILCFVKKKQFVGRHLESVLALFYESVKRRTKTKKIEKTQQQQIGQNK